MNKSILVGVVILGILAVAGCRSTAIGTAAPVVTPAASTAATPAPSTAATPAAASDGVTLASSYSVSFESSTGVTSTGSLTNMSVNGAGYVFGSIVNAPGYLGTNAVYGSLGGEGLTLSISLSDALYGTVNASNGQISGTYTGLALGEGNWTATPLTKPKPSLSVDAGANQTILGTNIISLDGQVTGDAADVAWTQVSGPGTTNFASSDSAATTATVSTPGTYVFQLTAKGDGTSASGQVTIAVQAYVALGDSYSAGDGAGDYLADSADPRCLQSAKAYPELVDAKVAGANAIPAGTLAPCTASKRVARCLTCGFMRSATLPGSTR